MTIHLRHLLFSLSTILLLQPSALAVQAASFTTQSTIPDIRPATGAVSPEGPLILSLEEAIERALDRSRPVRDAEFELRISESAVRQARSGFLPQAQLDAEYQNNIQLPVIFLPPGSPFGDVLKVGTTHTLNINAQVTLPLFNAQLIRGVSLSEAGRELRRRMLDASRQEIVTEVQRAYINILLAEESLGALERSLQQREENLQLVRSMVEQQVAPEFDLIRTSVQVENLRPQVRQAENALTGAHNYLKLLTGIPLEQKMRLSGTLQEFYDHRGEMTGLPSALTAELMERNPDLVQLDAQLDVTREQHRMNLAEYYPSLTLVGVNMHQSQGDQFRPWDYNWIGSTFVGVRLSIPLFSGLQRKFRNDQSRIRIEQQLDQIDFFKRSLGAEYDNARNRMLLARESVQAQRLNVEQAERGYEIALVGYENGTQNLLEVTDAELALTESRLNWLNSIHEYIDAALQLEHLLGLEPSLFPASGDDLNGPEN